MIRACSPGSPRLAAVRTTNGWAHRRARSAPSGQRSWGTTRQPSRMHPSLPGGGAGEDFGETSRFGETCRCDRCSRAEHFAGPALEPAMTPAPAACNILGFEECTKATPSRNESATEYAARLLSNARPAPGSWLDAFLSLAGRESVARHARRPSAWWSPGGEPNGRRTLR